MGAKDWMLAFCETDPRVVLRGQLTLDHAAARAAAERLHPGQALTAIPDGNLQDNSNPPDELIYVGAFRGLTIVCGAIAAQDPPSELPRSVIEAIPASRLYLHAMHSVVDWFAYAVWNDGLLQRALSLSPDSGIVENVGTPAPFEQPFWAGEHPAIDPDDDPEEEPYPLPFHPLELAEEALRELLGFVYEGWPHPDDVDPSGIPLAGFRIS
jgi:hypothetical protein